ncbi:MAG: PCP reductase family protein [Acidobacteria bacterium]|nr:PCP reductase family protein [Acidobacteriota bacterium]
MLKEDKGASPVPGAETGSTGGCPFGALLGPENADATKLPWTDEARQRLENIPAFVRPMAKRAIEQMARDRGQSEVNEKLMDLAKGTFMGPEDGG